MKITDYITVTQLCTSHEIDTSFVSSLHDMGLIQLARIEDHQCIHKEAVHEVERMIRLHRDLDVNPEGIDVIFNLLEKVETLHEELNSLRNRLKLYES
ncbi:MAG: MerR family transcriptional regulator [Altibacter sp.]|uniref:chaperone modulator CbpM n=1 Tax=Altibacter sp. TaxID=2024823 RepID=UPI000C957F93|nr:chaperone modulator CbpM [Altibacter sp.]MAP56089.1 MerR family transcriptional regulator [Altibacter sp.]